MKTLLLVLDSEYSVVNGSVDVVEGVVPGERLLEAGEEALSRDRHIVHQGEEERVSALHVVEGAGDVQVHSVVLPSLPTQRNIVHPVVQTPVYHHHYFVLIGLQVVHNFSRLPGRNRFDVNTVVQISVLRSRLHHFMDPFYLVLLLFSMLS